MAKVSRRAAEEDRGTDGPTGRVFAATGRPQGTPLRLPEALHPQRAGLKPAPTVVDNSTDVRAFQEGWRFSGIGLEWWGEIAHEWELVGRG